MAKKAAAPQIIPSGGEFEKQVTIEIQPRDPLGETFYTVDESDPTRQKRGTRYVAPFVLEAE